MTDDVNELKLNIGLNAIASYKRMAYQIWYALAEFIDNSTQNYRDNQGRLDGIFAEEGQKLEVLITYERLGSDPVWRIADNAMGMDEAQLTRALHVAVPPDNPTGRSRYGMGMKTAACWIGNLWTVRTKKLGSDTEITVEVDVAKIASGNANLPTTRITGLPTHSHYTIIEIRQHNKEFKGRTIGKIRTFLGSIYRQDFRAGSLTLEFNGEPLVWQDFDSRLRVSRDGEMFKKDFALDIDGKAASGWAGVLDKGSRADAGFSILHSDRMVQGWPDAWRPEKIFGVNRNDLLNQRLIGEIHLDDFEVSHTKDAIQWYGDEEEKVEKSLKTAIDDLIQVARSTWKSQEENPGPSDGEIDVALSALRDELTSPEMIDQIDIETMPTEDVIKASMEEIAKPVVEGQEPSLRVGIGEIDILVYLAADLSPNDPYVINEADVGNKVVVVINTRHPHMKQVHGSDGVMNYFRHCIYDALAEWAASRRKGGLQPHTVKLLKDGFLRVAFQMEQRLDDEPDDEDGGD